MKHQKWTQEDIQFLKLNYGLLSIANIQLKIGHTKGSIITTIHSLGLSKDKDKKWNTRSLGMTKYSLDEDFFQTHPNRFYWAGFIAADGNIADRVKENKQNQLRIELNKKDKHHLEGFIQDINYTGKILKSAKNCYRIVMTSDKVCDDLKNIFNIIPNKTHILIPPSNLTLLQTYQYIKGYLDGDGCLFVGKASRKNRVTIHVCAGTTSVLNWIKLCFDNITPNNTKAKVNIVKGGTYWQYIVSNSRAKQIYKIIKESINIGLDRKWKNKEELWKI